MKTFIYFSQGEWRTFQAEELPVKPHEFIDQIEQYDIWQEYESEIAALKAKSLPVENPEICPQNVSAVEDGKIYEWPGTVEVKEESGTCTRDVCYEEQCMNGDCGRNKLAILKLPA